LVLCYHGASDTWRHALATPSRTIETQIRVLLRLRWRAVHMNDVLHARGRVFHVTFDDAFRSAVRVLPTLERLRVPVTMFVCPEFADAGAPLVVPELANEPHEELLTMPWEQLEELAARGIAVESHTLSHPHLPHLTDDELDRELRDSKQQIEDRLRRACRFVAYPFGDEDARVRRAAERAGYDAAFALPGRQRPLARYALPRVGAYRQDTPLRLVLKSSLLLRRAAGRRG
jgi:peptidoglycan/xylan/chitin deacetylase (PgdA/CDA1 family)